MTTSKHWCNASPDCRVELRASRWLAAALASLGLAAAAGLLLTDLPAYAVIVLAPAVSACGLWLARQESRRPPRRLVLRGDGGVRIDGVAPDAFQLAMQGPLTRFQWRVAGRTERVVAWPDVVDAARRRELRLWAAAHRADARPAAVAP